MPETCQHWSHRNGEGRTEHLLQPWMDMDTHTPSQRAAAQVTGKTRQIYVPGLLLLPRRGNQHSIWGAKRDRLPAKARHSHGDASRLKVSKHTSSRTWLPASIRLSTMFLQPQWSKSSWSVIPPALISSDKTEQMRPGWEMIGDNRSWSQQTSA